MPNQLLFALLVEAALITLTMILLLQPRPFFTPAADRSRNLATMSGLFVLCITFCWSVIFGCVLALHQLTFRI
jgi:hypothetical protein